MVSYRFIHYEFESLDKDLTTLHDGTATWKTHKVSTYSSTSRYVTSKYTYLVNTYVILDCVKKSIYAMIFKNRSLKKKFIYYSSLVKKKQCETVHFGKGKPILCQVRSEKISLLGKGIQKIQRTIFIIWDSPYRDLRMNVWEWRKVWIVGGPFKVGQISVISPLWQRKWKERFLCARTYFQS